MSSVSYPWKGWLPLNDYLASGAHDRPVLLVLDSLANNGDDSNKLRDMLESPSIHDLLEAKCERLYDYLELHPELHNIVALTIRATAVDSEQPAVFVLSSDLLPTAAIATRSSSQRFLPVPRVLAQLSAVLSGHAVAQSPREGVLEQRRRDQISACLSATLSEAPRTWRGESLDPRPFDDRLKSTAYRITKDIVDYLDTENPGIVYLYTDHVTRWTDLGVLSILARGLAPHEPQARALLSVNVNNMATSQMFDVIHGGLFNKTDFTWCNASPLKILRTQFRFVELLLDGLRICETPPYRHLLQWTLECCLRDFLRTDDQLFVPSRFYVSGSGSLMHWSVADFAECLSAEDLQFLEGALDLDGMRRSRPTECAVRLKRLDLDDTEFERVGRLAREVGSRKRREVEFAPSQPPLMSGNAHAAKVLLEVGAFYDNEELEILGTQILDRLWTGFDQATGSLGSTFYNGRWEGTAALIDYAFLTEALFACYSHKLNPEYLERAEAVHRATLSRFWNEEHGTFGVFSRTYTDQLDALRGMDFLSGVGAALKNHVLFRRLNGEEPTAFIGNVLRIYSNGLVHGADEEFTDIVDLLNACAAMNPAWITYGGGDRVMWRECLRHVYRLPSYCRHNIIMLDPHHKQSGRLQERIPAVGEPVPNALHIWREEKPVTTLLRPDEIEPYFDELRREFVASLASISAVDDLALLRKQKEAQELTLGVR